MNKLSSPLPLPPFERVALITTAELIGARWWHEGMAATTVSSPARRFVLQHLLGAGGLIALATCGLAGTVVAVQSCDDDDVVGALALQRNEGWDVGSTSEILIPDASLVDSAGSSNWAPPLASLGDDLAPSDPRLMPLHVPTLFDVLRDQRSGALAKELKPMNSWAMGQAFLTAQGLADLFADAEQRRVTALVLDLPGPESVAAAAGLARSFTPVFLFDNWPHPVGVVPSHLTLAAAIYNRPEFVAAARAREHTAPPAFVLDSNRLLPYTDESERFDNRYFARMPTAATLTQLGVQRILYVTATNREHEEDDLNEDFVNYEKANIHVKMVSLYEFEAVAEEASANLAPNSHGSYRYRGHSSLRARNAFFSSYYGTQRTGGPLGFDEPIQRTASSQYSPAPRNTLFRLGRLSGDALHFEKSAPADFGRSSPHVSRSGSFGRAGSHSFG